MNSQVTLAIRGAGGKDGGGAGGLQEAPDTLRSVAYAQIVDLIGEGEMEGFPTTGTDPASILQHVYFDGTPVANADGTMNFKGATFDFRPGTQGQSHIEGFDDSSSEIAVGVEVKNSAAVVRTITDATINAIRVTLRVNSFYKLKSDGSMEGAAIEYTIEVQSNGGGYVPAIDRSIMGKSSGEYQRAHRLECSDYGPAPWDIRISRLTADHDADTSIQDALWWDGFTEIVEAKFRFPNSALSAIKIDSSQFGHIPTRGYDLKLLRVQVPANYDPVLRTYTGSWDGTFKIAWTDNPAWCFRDMLTTERYGLGNYIAADQVDKWALYQIAQYCDGLVDDGSGGQEPRFVCNLYLQKRQDAYTALTQFASIFRGMVYWGAGSLVSIQDAPSDPVALYTPANVIGGQFTYSGASRRARHTVALVQWNNPNNLYHQEIEYVEDRAGIARYGVVQTEVVAVGCTSRGQAHRVGRWLIYSERQETETVTFRTGMAGIMARPGQIIQIADAHRAGVRRGGRIKSATTTAITLDAPVTLDPAYTYTFSLIGPGGVLAQEAVQTPAQATISDVVTLVTALAAAPDPGSVWVLSGTDITPTTWRVVGVTEPEKATYEVTAVANAPGKYAEIDFGIILESLPVTTLYTAPAAPANLALTQSAHQSGSTTSLMISASCSPVVGAQQYRVAFQVDGGNVVHLPATETPHIDIPLSAVGTYTVTVRAVNSVGLRSPSVAASAYYDGTSLAITLAQPVVTAEATADGIGLSWGQITNASSYVIMRSADGATGWVEVALGVQTVYWRDPIADGATHYYTVTAIGHFGASSVPSATVSATADRGSALLGYLDQARPIALWRTTGLAKVGADDLSKHAEVTQHIGGKGVATLDLAGLKITNKLGKNILRETGGPALDRTFVKALTTDPDTFDGVPEGSTYNKSLAAYMDTGRQIALWRPTGLVKVNADDLSKHAEVTQHIGGLGIATVNLDSQVASGTNFHRVGAGYADTSGRVNNLWRVTGIVKVAADDLSKHAEVTQHIGGLGIATVNLDSQVASGTNFHRVGSGYADSSGRVNNLWRVTGIVKVAADDLSKHAEVTQHIGGLGVATLDLAGAKISNKTATAIAETTGRKWAAVSGATKNLVPTQYAAENLFADPHATNLALWESPKQWTQDGSGGMVSPALAAAAATSIAPLDGAGTRVYYKAKAGTSVTLTGAFASTGGGAGNIYVACYDDTDTVVPGGYLSLGNQTSGSAYVARVLPAGTTHIQPYLWSTGGASGGQMTISDFGVAIGSQTVIDAGGARVGDGRNLIALNSAGYATAYWTGVTMDSTYSSVSLLSSVAATAGTLHIGGVSIAYNSWSAAGLSPATLYYYVLNDPSYAGGSPSVIYSTSKHTVIGADGYVYIGSFTTAAPGSGGGGGIGACVALDMFIAPHIRAARAHERTRLACADGYQLVGTRPVNHMYYATEPCVRIAAANGAALVCSESTPFTLPDGSTLLAPAMLHQHVLTDRGDSEIQTVTPVGSRPVARISLGGLSFAAGEDPMNRIYSHNTVKS